MTGLMLQGLRLDALVAPSRRSHGGGTEPSMLATSAPNAHAVNGGHPAAPRRSRDAAVSAALGMSRRLSGAGGGALWQHDPLRGGGMQHVPAPHLPAHIYQVRQMSCVDLTFHGSFKVRLNQDRLFWSTLEN